MRLSVALCTYNGEAFLAQQLTSIATQSRLPDELIVCDDCSTDSTLTILNEFAASSPFPVRLFHNEQNVGTTRNFEKAIGLCEGDLIALADQDDIWLPDKLRLSEAALSANPEAGLVFTDAEVVDANLNPLGFRMWEAVLFDDAKQQRLTSGQAFEVLLQRNVVTGATLMFRAQYRELVLPLSTLWVHDAWIAILIALFAPLAIVPQPLMLYRQHGKNQIGIARPGSGDESLTTDGSFPKKGNLYQRVRRTKYRDPYPLRMLHYQFGPVRDRMIAHDKSRRARQRYQVFSDYIAHVGARGFLPTNRWQRLPTVISELVRLRYHRFSPGGILPLGLSIALADLLWDTLIDEEDSFWARHYQFVMKQFKHSHAGFFDEAHFKQLTSE